MNAIENYQVRNFESLPGSALVSIRVVGAVKGISDVTVWRRIRDGKLTAVKEDGSTRVTVASLRASMQSKGAA